MERESEAGKASPEQNHHQLKCSNRPTIDHNEILTTQLSILAPFSYLLHLSWITSIELPTNSTVIIFAFPQTFTKFEYTVPQHFQNPFDRYQWQYPQNSIHGVLLILTGLILGGRFLSSSSSSSSSGIPITKLMHFDRASFASRF